MHPTQWSTRIAWAVLAVLTTALLFVLRAPTPAEAASTVQSNGCLGVTGTFSEFAVPITASASPDPVTSPDPITLAGVSVEISVSSSLIGTGVTTGLVSAAPTLADIGTSPGPTTPNGRGVNAVTAEPGDVKLQVTGSNTAEGTQTVTNTDPLALTFYVTKSTSTGVVTVYSAISTPPATTADPARTGTALTGDLPVNISLGNSTWTPTGGNVEFTELNTAPSNLLTPDIASKEAAPLILLPKINGFISVPFYCWPGTVSDAPPGPNPLVPGSSGVIESTSVVGGTPTSSTSSTSTSSTSTSTSTTSSTTSTTSSTTTTSTTVQQAVTTTGTANYMATCSNSITPDVSTFDIGITGTAPAHVNAGDEVTLSNQTWMVTVPGSVLDTGLNLGLLQPGQTAAGTVTPAIFASNTAEGARSGPPVAINVGPIEVDGVTGLAKPVATTFAVPDMTWTAVGGEVTYRMTETTVKVAIGALEVDFTCSPPTDAGPIVKSAVIGQTDIPPAQESPPSAGSDVQGEAVQRASSTGEQLPRTGQETVGLALLGLILLDLGYLVWSSARPSRRWQH